MTKCKKEKCKVGCPPVARKEFLAEVVIKRHGKKPLPDFGLGKGVLMKQEIAFRDERGRGFDTPLFVMALVEHEDRLLKEAVEVRWTEIKKR